jgi:phosphomannomutase
MRDEGAVYGGEMSAHHYFRDFVYCDSGMIPWLLVAELVSRHGPLADLVAHRRAAFPSSGEINFTLDDPTAATARVRDAFAPIAQSIDEMDGSNTEPVVRLNVEARGDTALVSENVARLKTLLNGR